MKSENMKIILTTTLNYCVMFSGRVAKNFFKGKFPIGIISKLSIVL